MLKVEEHAITNVKTIEEYLIMADLFMEGLPMEDLSANFLCGLHDEGGGALHGIGHLRQFSRSAEDNINSEDESPLERILAQTQDYFVRSTCLSDLQSGYRCK
ncbi:hypothetical protein AA309_04685 [Microvirga vignae]|uniref:Uncharacterized protein n=1 Tax=Microvirga vignae TaxID=1225564 RepID=A0A0H1RGC0_9HYPH|nr:hypothetical protein AA309_04685 [Microvirga vignae]